MDNYLKIKREHSMSLYKIKSEKIKTGTFFLLTSLVIFILVLILVLVLDQETAIVNLSSIVDPSTILRFHKILEKLLDVIVAPFVLGYLILKIEAYQKLSEDTSSEIENMQEHMEDLSPIPQRKTYDGKPRSEALQHDLLRVIRLSVEFERKYAEQLQRCKRGTNEHAKVMVTWYSDEQNRLTEEGLWNRYIEDAGFF